MYFGENDDAFTPLCRYLDRRSAVTWEDLRDLGYGRRMVGCAVKYKVLRPVAPGLYVDGRRDLDVRLVFVAARLPGAVITLESAAGLLGLVGEWFGSLHVVLPRGRHLPRTSPLGLRCVKRRGDWTGEEVVSVTPPGLRGVEVRCFKPLRTFAELAAAGCLDSAGDVGRELLERGEHPEVLLEALLRLGLTRRRAGDVMFEVFAPVAHRTPPVDG
ncbi:MAG: hypothetical protein RL653_3584 [Pseudomonadota bacterium]|jgi:hypothetical protein